MTKRIKDGAVNDSSTMKLYGAPPPLRADLVLRLQRAVEAARQDRTDKPKRSVNFFPDATPDDKASSG